MSATSVALGVATGIALRMVDPLLPAIAATALAVPIGAVIALLRRAPAASGGGEAAAGKTNLL